VHEQRQNLGEGGAGGDHLEYLALTGLKRFSLRYLFGPAPLNVECHCRGDDGCKLDLLGLELVRRIVVQHELPDHATKADQRNEGQSDDSFVHERRQVLLERRFVRYVRDEDRLGVHGIGRPGRVTLHCSPILTGQAAVRLEPHHSV
jgi:hypothetical protein